MRRVKVDKASPAVKKFIQSLSLDANGVEVELNGRLVCKIIRPSQLSDADKAARLADIGVLLQRSRARSKRVSPRTIERDIRSALATVRGKR